MKDIWNALSMRVVDRKALTGMARALAKSAAMHNLPMTHSQALHALATTMGFGSANALSAATRHTPLILATEPHPSAGQGISHALEILSRAASGGDGDIIGRLSRSISRFAATNAMDMLEHHRFIPADASHCACVAVTACLAADRLHGFLCMASASGAEEGVSSHHREWSADVVTDAARKCWEGAVRSLDPHVNASAVPMVEKAGIRSQMLACLSGIDYDDLGSDECLDRLDSNGTFSWKERMLLMRRLDVLIANGVPLATALQVIGGNSIMPPREGRNHPTHFLALDALKLVMNGQPERIALRTAFCSLPALLMEFGRGSGISIALQAMHEMSAWNRLDGPGEATKAGKQLALLLMSRLVETFPPSDKAFDAVPLAMDLDVAGEWHMLHMTRARSAFYDLVQSMRVARSDGRELQSQ